VSKVAVAERHETLVAAFEGFRREPVFGQGNIRQSREAAFKRFSDRGFPTTRDEEWKFTSVAPIVATKFVRARAVSPDRRAIERHMLPETGATIVLVNGRVSAALSTMNTMPAGVTVSTGVDVSASTRHAAASAFVDLNDAFFEDVVAIRVRPKAVVTSPIHVLSLSAAGGEAAIVAPRLLIQVGEGAQVSVIETYAGLPGPATLTTAVTRLFLDPAAVVNHVKIQSEEATAFHIGNLAAWLGRGSTLTSHALTFGSRIARNDITAVLDGEGAECTLDGLYVGDGESLLDTHTTIDHAKPHCPSHERYKGILAGRAKAVFNGKIIVRQDAQKTDAKQTNRALLLSDDAQVNTKPQLEIFADDVKCTHGAAIGQLDDDALFYLRARGISEIDARNLLIHAFAAEVLTTTNVGAAREHAMHLLEAKLSLAEVVPA
jgi:Fe-S cluster assembly protein SufD